MGDYEPFDHRVVALPNKDYQALANLIKSALGSGILAMPLAFKNAGLLVGAIGTIIVGYICNHCAEILVQTAYEMCKELRIPNLDYGETFEQSFALGPESFRKHSGKVRVASDIAMSVTYMGTLCVYVVMMATSIKQLVEFYGGADLHFAIYAVAVYPFLILLVQIKNLKHLAPFSVFANFLFVCICIITFYFIFIDLGPITERTAVASIVTYPAFISTTIFAMEGIGIVLPLESEMENPSHFLGCPGVLYISMAIIVSMYGSIGFLGYWRYGDDIKATITLNLDNDNPAAQTAKFMIIIAIFFTYAVQYYVCIGVVLKYLKPKFEKNPNIGEFVLRVVVVSISIIIGCVVPKLNAIIGIVGSVFFSTLGLFCPAFMQLVFRWDRDLGRFKYILWKDLFLIIFSLITLVCGTFLSILDLIE